MTRWLGWSVLAATLIAGGYLAALNPGAVEVAIGPDRRTQLPLGVVVTGAMGAGALAVGAAALLAGMRRSLAALGRRREARRIARHERRAEHGPEEALDDPDLAAATQAAERALRERPESPWLLRRLRDLEARVGHWPEALALTERLVVRLRTPALLEDELGALRALRHQVARAAPDARTGARALLSLGREDPGFVAAWVAAGDRLLEAGRVTRARRAWIRGTKHRPAPILLARIEGLDAGSGHAARTTRLYRRLMRRHPDDRMLPLLFARHLLRIGARDGAASVLSAPLASPIADALRGELARQHGDFEAAAAAFERALGPDLGLHGGWTCTVCGAAPAHWEVRCPQCRRWNALAATARAGLGPQDSPG